MTKETGIFFVKLVDSVKEVANSFVEMKDAMQELAEGSNQIIQALGSLVEITDGVKTSSFEMDINVEKITDSMKNLSSISTEVGCGMGEIIMNINELNKAIIQEIDWEMKNTDNIQELEKLVDQFKTEENISEIEPYNSQSINSA